MKSMPGINQTSIWARSSPAFSHRLSHSEKKMITSMNRRLIQVLIRKEEEAIAIFSFLSGLALTYLTCAFFSRLLLVASKTPVIIRNKAQVPSWFSDIVRVRIMKLMRPKKVNEKRWKKE